MSQPRPAPPPSSTIVDPQLARLLRMLRAGAPVDWESASIMVRRKGFDGLLRLAAPPQEAIAIEERTIEGRGGPLPLRIYSLDGTPGRWPGLIYFHGGGLVAGSLDGYDPLLRTLAAGFGCRLLAVGYRLAPEHPYPAAIDDALAATRHLLDHGADFGLERIAIGGDSAGATLTAIVTQTLRDEGDRRLAAQVMLCPVLDFVTDWPSKRAFGDGFLLDGTMMARDLVHYAPRVPLDHPHVSPLRAKSFAGLPPAVIHTAACDPLADEGAAYAEALRGAGVPIAFTCHAGMVHHFYGLASMSAAARSALARTMADVAMVLRA